MSALIVNEYKENKQYDHLDYIDIGKGILILLVVTGHIFPESVFKCWIYGFHVQAFLILSGIVTNHSRTFCDGSKRLLRRKALTTIKEILIFEMGGVVGHIIRFGFRQKVTGIVFDAITLRFNNVVNWYLIAMLIANILLYVCLELSKVGLTILGLISFCIAVVLPSNHFYTVLSWGLIAFFAMSMGRLYEKKLHNAGSNIAYITVALMLTIIAVHFNGRISIYDHALGNPIWFLISTISGAILVIGISIRIKDFFIAKPLRLMGINSLYIMGFHLPVNNLLIRISGTDGESLIYSIVALPCIIMLIIITRKIISSFLYNSKCRYKNDN